VFLINITERERAGLLELLRKQPGVEMQPVIVTAVAATLESIDGTPTAQRTPGTARRYRRPRSVTWAAEKAQGTEIVEGAWWTGKPAAPLVSVSEEAARLLQVKPGTRLVFSSFGRTIAARVAAIHRTESIRPGAQVEFTFSPGALDGLPASYYGGMRVRAADVPALQRAAWRAYPTVTVINAADVLEIVQDVIDNVATVVRFVSLFAILAGAVVLASSVTGTRLRRMREMAVLKALGATRRRLAAIYSMELAAIGVVAGVLGSLLATGFSALLLNRLFESDLRLDVLPNALAVAATAFVSLAGGWAAGYRHLNQKPLDVLRDE
jgi:putative ABC transport system permease protein